jgi:PAS domain S-box-containing protein
LPNSIVYAITANNPDSILIGTDGGGLAYYNRITETYTVYNTSNTNLKSNRIWSLLIDNNQNIWVGTHQGGLTLFQKKGDEYISSTFENSLTDENLIVGVTVNDIFQDTNGNIWIGTDLGFNKVIFIKNKVSFQKFKSIFEDNTTISENYVTSICEDKDKNLWIGTSFGLNKYVIEENKFYRYFHDIKDSTSLNNDYITTLYIDLNGNLWIGTKGGGINLFNKTTNSFSNYTENDGLINNSIKAITEDKSGNLWISTSFGLSQFDFKNRTFKNYDNKHGLISTGFNYNSVYQASDGELFFGSISGLSYFYPDKIVDNPNKPKIIIKDIKISNYSIFNDVKNEIYKQLINNSTLVFDYTQNIISFDFIAMDFTNPEGNLYAYYLENFEEKWNYSGNRNYVTYTNLKPGNYTLKIKAANSDGIWNEEGIEIKIKILPPFWETWFFRIFVFLFVLITIISIYRLRVRKIKIQNKKFEDQVKQRTAEVEQQKEEIKAQSETLIIANEELQKLSFVASKTDNAVTILDPEGNLEWINEGFSRLYGYTFEEVINSWGKNIREFSSNEKIISLIENCILSKKSVVYEGQLESKSGNKIWAQTTLTPILDEKNNVTKLITIDTDITKIIDAEKEITRQRDEIKEQTEQLNSINEMLFANNLEIDERNKLIEEKNLEIEKAYTDFKLLSTLGQEITTFLDEQKIYDTLIKNINVFFDVDLFKIGLYNQSNNSLEFHTTIDKGNLSQLYSISLNEENNLAVVCFNNNQDVIINDFDLEYKFYILKDLPTSNEEKTTSIIYLPLTSKEKKLGVISIQNFNRNAYKEQHINVLRNLALYISIALDNSSVYKKVEIQKNEIQKKNRDITDSINYAKRIQNAILQRPEFLITNNQEFFIMYKPKQIISGDFYWFKEISSVEFICIVADCTGHGVPGAFMSMLGIAFLNEIISQNINISTSVVLNLLRKKVKSSLKQTGKDKESRDGMDISIVKINKKYKTLQFSGAFNTIFLIQNGIMIKPVADKMPIGIYQIETDFTHEDFNIETGDVLYMFSDGFADQFGEKTNRRFLFKNFISVINEIYLQPMHEQHLILNSTLIEWQGREPQLDDILIFGIRLEV